jgi:hypothetical protein
MRGKTCAGTWVKGVGTDGNPREVYLYHVVDNADSMRDYGAQAVVWQTAINPVAALELLATGTWKGAGVLGPEAFDAVPFLDLLTAYGSPWGSASSSRSARANRPRVRSRSPRPPWAYWMESRTDAAARAQRRWVGFRPGRTLLGMRLVPASQNASWPLAPRLQRSPGRHQRYAVVRTRDGSRSGRKVPSTCCEFRHISVTLFGRRFRLARCVNLAGAHSVEDNLPVFAIPKTDQGVSCHG